MWLHQHAWTLVANGFTAEMCYFWVDHCVCYAWVLPSQFWVVYQFPRADLTKSVEISDLKVTFPRISVWVSFVLKLKYHEIVSATSTKRDDETTQVMVRTTSIDDCQVLKDGFVGRRPKTSTGKPPMCLGLHSLCRGFALFLLVSSIVILTICLSYGLTYWIVLYKCCS